MKVVPEDVSTAPLEGLASSPQLTTIITDIRGSDYRKSREATTHWYNILSQTGAAGLQTPVGPLVILAPQVLLSLPTRTYPMLQV